MAEEVDDIVPGHLPAPEEFHELGLEIGRPLFDLLDNGRRDVSDDLLADLEDDGDAARCPGNSLEASHAEDAAGVERAEEIRGGVDARGRGARFALRRRGGLGLHELPRGTTRRLGRLELRLGQREGAGALLSARLICIDDHQACA
jgi:hypothetical protein